MRTGRVIAAGLCFLAVATPNISTAQSPKAKAANAVVGVVKQTSRLKWSTSQGSYFDPPYKLFGSDRAVVDKVPNAVRWIGGGGTSFGAGHGGVITGLGAPNRQKRRGLRDPSAASRDRHTRGTCEQELQPGQSLTLRKITLIT